jgi:hypothetical protein
VVPSKANIKLTTSEQPSAIEPQLQRIIDAWQSLPPAIKAGILAMIEASRK